MKKSSANIAAELDVGELTIVMRPHDEPICEYKGTRLQLEANGLIPRAAKWPDGYADLRWTANGIKYLLRRERPDGEKGPRRQFIDCDNWCLRTESEYRNRSKEFIQKKACELAAAVHACSHLGRAETSKNFNRYMEAKYDEDFQKFLTKIPSITETKKRTRGRPPMYVKSVREVSNG